MLDGEIVPKERSGLIGSLCIKEKHNPQMFCFSQTRTSSVTSFDDSIVQEYETDDRHARSQNLIKNRPLLLDNWTDKTIF